MNAKQEVNRNLIHNAHHTSEIARINDSYLRYKLATGLIKYEPRLWELAQLDPMEENGKR